MEYWPQALMALIHIAWFVKQPAKDWAICVISLAIVNIILYCGGFWT